jgi:hypothetical protein
MGSRRVSIVVLCEDQQQGVFLRRFLLGFGVDARGIRVQTSPAGAGSAEQYVRREYPCEVNAYRNREKRVQTRLIVVVDADQLTVDERHAQFTGELANQNVPPRADRDLISIVVPKRNIETWIRHLLGNPTDEATDYQKLDRPRKCQPAVEALRKIFDACPNYPIGVLPSLERSCDELARTLPP